MKHVNELLQFWGLSQLPFCHQIRSDDMYFPATWQPILERLVLAGERHSQLTLMTSPAGHGKTSLCRWLYQQIDNREHEVFLISLLKSEKSQNWLTNRLLKLLRVDAQEDQDRLEALIGGLEELKDEERGLCIIIDDIHKVSGLDALEDIHTMIGIGSALGITINLVLVGLPHFKRELLDHRNLAANIGLQCALPRLSLEETGDFLKRTLLQNHFDPKILSNDGVRLIHNRSGGLFLRINKIMENALIEAFLRRQKRISRELIEQAAQLLPSQDELTSREDSVSMTKLQGAATMASNLTEMPPDGQKPVGELQNTNGSIALSSLFYSTDEETIGHSETDEAQPKNAV